MRIRRHRPLACTLGFMAIAMMSMFLSTDILAQEARYVSDKVRLNMYQDTSLNKRMAILKSGDRVDVLKSDDGYSQVQTSDGSVGWVKTSFLVKDKPAIVKLAEVQDELDNLRSKHTDLLIEQNDVPVAENSGLLSQLEAAENVRKEMETRLAQLESQKAQQLAELKEYRQQTDNTEETQFFLLWIILPILTLITGFFLGWKYMDSKIRAKFGGFSPL